MRFFATRFMEEIKTYSLDEMKDMKALIVSRFKKVNSRLRECMVKIPVRFLINPAIVMVTSLSLLSGCHYYKIVTKIPTNEANALHKIVDKKYPKDIYPRNFYPEGILVSKLILENPVYAIDSTGRWLLEDALLKGDTLYCRATFSPVPPETVNPAEYRKSKRFSHNDKDYFTKRVNLYVEILDFDENGMVLIPISAISEYDIYKRNRAKRAAVGIGIVVSIVFAFSIYVLVGLMTTF